jgi:hypothetical protein
LNAPAGEVAGVTAQNAKDAADEWVARARLPEKGDGRKLRLVTFQSDEDCRFFYPRRAMEWHRQVNTYISRALRPRGIRVERLCITPEDYRGWLGGRGDTLDLRREYADGLQKLLDP